MGCFSYLCSCCGEPIRSDSYSGERCTLYSIKNGVVIESMTGQYNSYGQVFKSDLEEVHDWEVVDWDGICMGESVIHAVHEKCKPKNYKPFGESEGDDNQGWGDYDKDQPTGSCHLLYELEPEEDEEYEIFWIEDTTYEIHKCNGVCGESYVATTKELEIAEKIVELLSKES